MTYSKPEIGRRMRYLVVGAIGADGPLCCGRLVHPPDKLIAVHPTCNLLYDPCLERAIQPMPTSTVASFSHHYRVRRTNTCKSIIPAEHLQLYNNIRTANLSPAHTCRVRVWGSLLVRKRVLAHLRGGNGVAKRQQRDSIFFSFCWLLRPNAELDSRIVVAVRAADVASLPYSTSSAKLELPGIDICRYRLCSIG